MEKDQYEKKSLEMDQDFPRFLKRLRKEENILLDQLSEGLMSVSQLARIEKGQRPISKNMRDRLLGRLGVASDLYENLLNIEDYTAWEQERDIMCAVEEKKIQKAQELIAMYEKQEFELNRVRVKKQFCLAMRAEVLKQQNAVRQEIGACYEEAVKLTVPDIDSMHIEGKLLCIQEVNLVLEYMYYQKVEDFAMNCKELMVFVEQSVFDDLSKVKIYPKIVYYYLQEIFIKQREYSVVNLNESLEICNRAIGMLRDTGKSYYLLELLEIRNRIMECTEEMQDAEENTGLADLLKALYTGFEVPMYMQDCTYLYRQRWMFCAGDVLRVRRQMKGLTQKALCEGICSVRTLRRAEKKDMNMQYGVSGVLMKKLGLSKEFQSARLVTNDKEVLKLKEKMVTCRNNRDLMRAREILKEIRDRVSVNIPENRQYFMELEASLDWMEGKITKEEFAQREEAALQCTLNIKELYRLDETFLTEMEMSCIRNRIQVLDDEEKSRSIKFLLRFFEQYEGKSSLGDCMPIYEYVMICIVCELGNLGEHQAAKNLGKKALKEILKCRRIWGVDGYLYEILWDEQQQIHNEQAAENEKMTEGLRQCIVLSHFCKQDVDERFYCDKLYQE